jgi:hypothetical protein
VIELAMVKRMTVRGLLLAPALAVGLFVGGGADYLVSGLVGLAMMLGNIWLAARLIGGVAEKSPQLLLPVALGAFALGLILLTLISVILDRAGVIYFPVAGFVLIGSHLVLVLWEAAGAYAQPKRSGA